MSTYNLNINTIDSIYPPYSIKNKLPLNSKLAEEITQWRKTVSNIVHNQDNRIIVIVGPCSIHDPDAAIEYAKYLVKMKKIYSE